MNIDPRYIPEAPPGMVFFSNESRHQNDDFIIEDISTKYDIPKESIVVLRNLVPGNNIASIFFDKKYEYIIIALTRYLEIMLKALTKSSEELERLEND